MKSVSSIPKLNGIRVIVRVDYNVPIRGTRILDTRRVIDSYKTIDAILKKGGTPILVAHLGEGKESLAPIARYLSKKYKLLFLTTDIVDKITKETIEKAQKGTVILLENIRRYKAEGENKKDFVRALAKLGDYYVNDAFSVSHRTHASIIGIPSLLPGYAGYQLEAEIKALQGGFTKKVHPFIFILGGAKFSTKIPLLERFLEIADQVIIAGALVNDFFKVSGFEVGKSVIEAGYDTQIKKFLLSPKLLLPTDVVVVRGRTSETVPIDEVRPADKIVDVGADTISRIAKKIQRAKLVVWNGPTGWYEKGFDKGTIGLARAVASSKATTIIGGGDTGAVIEKILKSPKKNIFISTGGGATLEYLAKGTLPGIAVLEKNV